MILKRKGEVYERHLNSIVNGMFNLLIDIIGSKINHTRLYHILFILNFFISCALVWLGTIWLEARFAHKYIRYIAIKEDR